LAISSPLSGVRSGAIFFNLYYRNKGQSISALAELG
jgi:hypothetical protein